MILMINILYKKTFPSYCPVERWQHNLEHGCIVLLYHPCLGQTQVARLIGLLSSCVRKFVSTPSRLPSHSKPLILVGWGCYQEFSSLDEEAVVSFIRRHAMTGPEGNFTKDGLYTHLRVSKAHLEDDLYLC